MQGWIKLHRTLMEKSIWIDSTPEQKTILITLLMMANHEGREWEWKGQKYKAEPGQFVTSLPSLIKMCGKNITEAKLRTALKRFETYGFLTDKSTNKNRLITIVNWAFYQGNEQPVNSQDNRQITGSSQANHRQITANKNVRIKECNNNTATKGAVPEIDHSLTLAEDNESKENLSTLAEDDSSNQEVAIQTILNKFIALRAVGTQWSAKDHQAAVEIIQSGANLQDAVLWLEECFKNYKPKHARDGIKVLGYCVGYILDQHHKKLEQLNPSKPKTQKKYGNRKPIRTEMVPDWLPNQNEEVVQKQTKTDLEIEAERKKLEAELAVYKRKKS